MPSRKAKGDVDVDAGVIRVRRSQWRQQVTPGTKTGRTRTVPLVPELWAVLSDHRRVAEERQVRTGDADWVFPTQDGSLMYADTLNKPLRRAAKRAGITHRITAHGLRRTFNKLVRRVEADAVVIRSITGHSSESMREYYSHVGVAEKQRAQRGGVALTRNVGIGLDPEEGSSKTPAKTTRSHSSVG